MFHAFDLTVTARPDGESVLAVAGELDVATAPQFRRAVGELMGQGTRHLVLDLGETGFVDSCGLGAVLWAGHRLEAVGGELEMVNCVPRVRRAFVLAGLDGLLH